MFQSVSIFPLYNPLFQCFETPEMGRVFSPFSELVLILFRNVSKELKRLDLVNFFSCFSLFQFFPYIIHCFSVSKHQKWGLVFSPFSELVLILFRIISKQLKRLDLVNFLHVSVLIFSLYNPLFQCFETPEMGPGIFTFFRACFNFVRTFQNN